MHASCPRLFDRETRCSSATSVSRLRAGKAARWSVAAFLRAPFWTTVLVIFSPIPDSAVRVLAPLGKYPLPLLVLASVGIVLAGLGWRRLQRAGLTEP